MDAVERAAAADGADGVGRENGPGRRLEGEGEAAASWWQGGAGEEEVFTDEDSEGGGSRGPTDRIKVRVLNYQKTEEDVVYDIEVVVNNGQPLLLHHKYEDFKWLYRLLARKMDLNGHILPPLPEPPAALLPHQETLGAPLSCMFGGYSRLACLDMETFLQSLADHPFFSENHEVHMYLTREQLPSHDYIGNLSLWSSLTSAYSNYQLSSVQDSDEEFVVLLSNLNESIPVLETCSRDFSQLVTSWQKLACMEMGVSECVRREADWEVGRSASCAVSLAKLADVLDEDKKYNLSASSDALNTAGFTFDLLHRYSKQSKDMLYRRLEKLQALIVASRQLDKAKPEKKEAAEQARTTAMTAYDSINETAKTEQMERFRQQSATLFRANLVNLAESQLTHSRCLLAQLSALRSQLAVGDPAQ